MHNRTAASQKQSTKTAFRRIVKESYRYLSRCVTYILNSFSLISLYQFLFLNIQNGFELRESGRRKSLEVDVLDDFHVEQNSRCKANLEKMRKKLIDKKFVGLKKQNIRKL